MAGIWPGIFWDGCGNTVRDYSTGWSIGLWNPRKHGKNGNVESWLSFGNKVRWVGELAGLTEQRIP